MIKKDNLSAKSKYRKTPKTDDYLGADEHLMTAVLQNFSNELLIGTAEPVRVCSVNHVASNIDGVVEHFEVFFFIGRTIEFAHSRLQKEVYEE
jgi:alkaline phosphatase